MNWMARRQRGIRQRRARRAILAMGALTATATLAGLVLPADHLARKALLLTRPPEAVWQVLIDLDGMPRWRTDLRALERLPDRGGRPAWREVSSGGERLLELAEAEPPSRLVIQNAGDGGSVILIREFDLRAVERGTLLTVTERRRFGSPLRRILARLPLEPSGPALLLRDLDARLRMTGQLTANPAD
ncbi:MAG: SRPBCC family protein [Gemmatimonadales bacterium]